MNAAEYYVLLVQERAWTPAKFGSHLADAWRGLLLAHPADNGTTAPKSVP